MAKQLNVNMSFTADTTQAKSSIAELQQAIQKLGYGNIPIAEKINPAQFQQAAAAARELAYHLNNAYNTRTGNLDLNKLNQSLKSSGTTLTQLTSSFKTAGSTGQQAFIALSNAISQAELPSLRLNSRLETMFVTLKNVARFQISSSIMHGLIGAIQHAQSYAQNLDQSLNNIRIVTGQSADQMVRFAENANKSARQLSSTTLDYTNASLIYYQQGLSDEEVKKRTDVTIKMANVARESAQTVSDQMTAIWNNFDDGSHSLEYYADVITALGAATASSSAEISAGLEKFAAVADTVGLSYENATAALATVVAQTRQSADTIGTGFRTIFSRLQGLSLGDTLEDGVTLNKYSSALAKVGVQALDASGNLRRMDDVLEDLGARWSTLSETEQTALAQTVGGVRQYTTLIALMDNWDFMKQNQLVATGAEGTLSKQAEIFAESWEAARNRVKAATEGIYDALIDENFFISVDSFLEHLLTGIKGFITEFGGIRSIVIGLSGFLLSAFQNKIGPAIEHVIQNIQILTGGASKVYGKMQQEFSANIESEISKGGYTEAQQADLRAANNVLLAKTKIAAIDNKLTSQERMRANLAIQGLEMQKQHINDLYSQQEVAQKRVDTLTEKMQQEEYKFIEDKQAARMKEIAAQETLQQAQSNAVIASKKVISDYEDADSRMLHWQDKANALRYSYDGSRIFENDSEGLAQIATAAEQANTQVRTALASALLEPITPDSIKIFDELPAALNETFDTNQIEWGNILSEDEFKSKVGFIQDALGQGVLDASPALKKAFNDVFSAEKPEEMSEAVEKLKSELQNLSIRGVDAKNILSKLVTPGAWQDFNKTLTEVTNASERLKKAQEDLANYKGEPNTESYKKLQNEVQKAEEELQKLKDEIKTSTEGLNQNAQEFNPVHLVSGTQALAAMGSAAMQTSMAVNALMSLFSVWSNQDMSFGEKITSSLMSLGMAIPAIIGLIGNYQTAIQGVANLAAGFVAKQMLMKGSLTGTLAGWLANKLGIDLNRISLEKYTAAMGVEKIAQDLVSQGMDKQIAQSMAEVIHKRLATQASEQHAGAMIAESAAAKSAFPIFAAVVAIIAAIIAVVTAASRAYKEHTQAMRDSADELLERANKSKETADKNNQLAESYTKSLEAYNKAKEAGEDLTNVQSELNNSALEVAKAYDITNAALLVATENYEALTQAIRNKQAAELESLAAQANTAYIAQTAAYGRTTTDNGKGFRATGYNDRYVVSLNNGTFTNQTGGSGDERHMYQAWNDYMSSKYAGQGIKLEIRSGDLNFNTSGKTAADYIAVYDAIQETMTKAADLASSEGYNIALESETYNAARNYLEQNAEAYQKLVEARDLLKDATIQGAIKTEDLAGAKTLDEYNQKLQNIKDTLQSVNTISHLGLTDKEINDIVDSLGALSNTAMAAQASLKSMATTLVGETEAEAFLAKLPADGEERNIYIKVWTEMMGPEGNNPLGYTSEDILTRGDYEVAQSNAIKAKNSFDVLKNFANQTTKLTDDALKTALNDAGLLESMSDNEIAALFLGTDEQKRAWVNSKLDTVGANFESKTAIANTQRGYWDDALQKHIDDTYDQQLDLLEKESILQAQLDPLYGKTYAVTNSLGTTSYTAKIEDIAAIQHAIDILSDTTNKYTDTDKQTARTNLRTSMSAIYGSESTQGVSDNGLFHEALGFLTYNTNKKVWDTADIHTYAEATNDYKDNQAKQAELGQLLLEYQAAQTALATDSKLLELTEDTVFNNIEQLKGQATNSNIKWDDVVTNVGKMSGQYAATGTTDTLAQYSSMLGLMQQASNAKIDFEPVLEYAEALGKLEEHSQDTPEQLIGLSLATLQQAEASDIGAKKLLEYSNELEKNGLFSNLNKQELTELALSMQQMANETDIAVDEIANYTAALLDTEEFEGRAAEEVATFATAVLQQKRGIDSLNKSYNTWKKHLTDTAEHTDEWADAQKGAKKALSDILGIPMNKLSDNFANAAEEAGLLEKAANGDKEAIAELQTWAAASLLDAEFTGGIDRLHELTQALQQTADGEPIKITTSLDDSGALSALAELSQQASLTAEQISDYLSAAGWKPTISYETLPFNVTGTSTDGTSTITYQDSNGVTYTRTIDSEAVANAVNGQLSLPVIDGGKTNFKGSGGGGGSKGGGGGGGNKEPHKVKRYRNITNQLQNNDRKTNSISHKKDRAFGTEKLDLLKQERDLREENLKLQQQYQSEIEDWLDKDKNAMMEAFSAIGFTPIFDEFGEVINNDEFEAAFAAIGDGSDEAWKKAEEALAQYEETLDLLNDQLITIEELQEQIFDSLLEEAQIKIELKLNVSNDRLEYIDYLLTKIDDDAYQAAEAIALLGEQTGETMAQAATYAAGIEEILSHHALPDGTKFSLENIGNMSTEDLLAANFTQDEIDQIQEWRSSLLQANESLLEMRKTITDKLISAFEDLNEKVQRSYELFDHYNTTLEHYKNITDLIAKGNSSFQSRAALEALNRSSFTNSVNQLTAAKRILDDMPKYLAEAEQRYQDALASGDRDRIVQAERYLQTIQDREQEAREQWEEAWENSLESAQSFFEFTMENIAKDYEDTMSGMFGTLDYLQQAYERHKEDAEWYLESYDSLYQLGKLSRDISRAIDDTDSIRIKQRYRDLQAEINKLQKENAELTQHDIDMLQREFDLEVARAALEDAKNAKTQVRLQRDSEGNWGYVYTADEDKVNDALDKYAEALHAFQQTNHEYFSQIQDDFMDLLDVGTQITDIMSDLDITQDEALANIDDLMSTVLGDDGHLQRLLDDLKQANADEEKIRELFTEIYGEDAVNNWLTFDDTLLKDLLNVDNIEELRNLLTEAYEAAIKAGKEAREQLATDVGQVGDAAGVSVEDFGEHVHGLVQHLDEESLAAIQSVNDLATAMNTTFTQAMQQALQWEKDYADQMANVIAQNEAFITSINKMIEALSGINGIEFYTRVNGVTGSAGQAKFESFDSGGYTGNWGSYGRLAVLHEKEQIFNQDDTAKLLNAAQILRTLNLQTNLASQGLGQLNLSSMFDHINSDFNQNVQITAEFPNAINHSEIEEAFTNLINKASQYANRKGI